MKGSFRYHPRETTGQERFRWRSFFCLLVFLLLFFPDNARCQRRTHEIFFEGTDYELHVYRIYGERPGKTLLLIGGIQGDEPGGFLSVDPYADICLSKGNLIVVPRANFHSIVLRQRIVNQDMNRQFDEEARHTYETKVVSILKRLIQESDCLLNLHDGSGFYSDTWENQDRNPLRYGQSLIADAEVHLNPATGEEIRLGEMARAVAARINSQIENPEHHFRFNNHRSREEESPHKEQRKSATYYALFTCGVPAFGIETSKSLPLESKVRHHNLAINAFMDRLGIVQETPGVNLDPPELDYLVIAVNEELPVVVGNQQTLYVQPGDTIMISHIEANYERGLTADLIGFGTISDVRKKFSIQRETQIVVRKDYYPCGKVTIALRSESPRVLQAKGRADSEPPRDQKPTLKTFRIQINGKEKICRNNERVTLVKGDLFEIVDVTSENGDPSLWVVNFKGFVGDRRSNDGEDRGFVINTAKDLLARYSIDKQGRSYPVVVTYQNAEVGKLFVDLKEPGASR